MKNLAIIMSGGTGSRMGAGIPKQMLKIGDRSLLELTLRKFHEHRSIDEIYVVSHRDLITQTEEIRKSNDFFKMTKIIPGGATRQLSVKAGVFESNEDHENILIHDSARPYVSGELISRVLGALEHHGAVTPSIASPDTLVGTDSSGKLLKYLDRDTIKRVQTPQGFKHQLIREAHIRGADEADKIFTDDCSMISYFGLAEVQLVEGDPENMKITVPEDINRRG